MPIEMGARDRAFLSQSRMPCSSTRRSVRAADLFSGCGGLTVGVEEAARRIDRGLEVRLAIERDDRIAAAYEKNFQVAHGGGAQEVEHWFDRRPGQRLSLAERRTRKLVGALDILVGGPPCQGHSPLNNHTRGNDPKNRLYLAMVRAAEVLEPDCVLIENVPTAQRDSRGVVAEGIERLERLGYKLDHGVVRVAEIGVPQLRKRHVVLAHAATAPSLEEAIAEARVRTARTLRWAIGDLLRREGKTPFDTAGVLSAENLSRARFLLRKNLFDLPNWYRPPCQRNVHRYKSMYGRLDWNAPAQTITTGFGSPGQGRYLHPERPRTLTPHEAARIQFLPDWYDFSPIHQRTALAEAIGNAVPPKLAFVLAAHLLEIGATRRTSSLTAIA